MRFSTIVILFSLVIGVFGGLYFHASALTPIVPPIVDSVLTPEELEAGPVPLPMRVRVDEIDPAAPLEENYTMLDFHFSAGEYPWLVRSIIVWQLGLWLLVFFHGLRKSSHQRWCLVIGGVLSLAGIIYGIRATWGGVLSLDAMASSTEPLPGSLTFNIGTCLLSCRMGWYFSFLGALAFSIGILIKRKAPPVLPSKTSRIFSIIALSLIFTAALGMVWNLYAATALARVPIPADAGELAELVNLFLNIQGITGIVMACAMIFMILAFLKKRETVPA